MKILLTGATGYIGKRLLPVLAEMGHDIICLVRERARFHYEGPGADRIMLIEADLLRAETLISIPPDIDAAYYLVHSMSSGPGDFGHAESISAENFTNALRSTTTRHCIYLGGISNDKKLSRHLESRKNVERILSRGKYEFTAIRAGIIIGSGSSSFEIIRDLVEKLPIMIAPKWLHTKSQPIAIRDIVQILVRALFNEHTYGKTFDAGGPDILTYKEMLLQAARIRGLRRWILTVPVLSPRLSSYWLFFVTAISFSLARRLVDSMKVEIICGSNEVLRLLNVRPMNYEDAVRDAFQEIEQNAVISSWKDSLSSGRIHDGISGHIQVPAYGCYLDKKTRKISDREKVLMRVWKIGGTQGWYYGNFLWDVRGFLDKIAGGVGVRRGRTSDDMLNAGDSLDFWRVLYANRDEGRLLLYAEMKLPGEAWLEFRVDNKKITQTATFRPRGLTGRLYWYSVLPFHFFIFNGMIRNLSCD